MSLDVDELFRTHGTAILGYLARRVEEPADAADLLSDVMLVAWRRRSDVPGSPGDRAWLYGVARNVLANHRRSLRRRSAAVDTLRTVVERVVPPPSAESLDVRRILATLDPVDHEILTLTAWEGLTSSEIAGILHLPSSTVRARLARTRAILRDRLEVGASRS